MYNHSEIESKWQKYWTEYDTFSTQNPTKKTVLILHGWESSSDKNWFPWLKKTLTERGYMVFVPDLPSSEKPNLAEQLAFLANYKNALESDSIIIGHSLGAKLACHFIEKYSLNIGKLILVAPTYETLDDDLNLNEPEEVKNALNEYNRARVDLAKINVQSVTYLSDNDPYIQMASAKKFYANLPSNTFREFAGKGHFNTASGIIEFPEILELITSLEKPKFYALDMFPYPSGAGLHVGHPKGYTATDIIARYKHAKGFHVLHPMGWDAFGLPAENYAIKTGTHPAITTAANIDRFREQLKKFGFSFDWNREVDTTNPDYYKWSQWIFLKLFEAGLAYESDKPINFCPSCKTGLANEEVVDGKCERCGTPVEKKAIRQWILAITKYADRLLSDIDRLDWPKGIKEMQRNWIGRSEGVNFKNKVKDMDITFENYNSVPQTYHAETFTAIAPEHTLVYELVKGTPKEKEVMDFCEKIKAKKAAGKFDFEKDLEGIFTGRYVENFAGTANNLPIWVASYILADYGTGIVNCSAHDVRDFAFAKKHDILLHPVMFPADSVEAEKVRNLEYSYAKDDEGIMEEPALFKGRKWGEVREDIIDYLDKNGFAERKINYKLRDWIFSRQRYWGEPIPLIHIKDEYKESLPTSKNDDCWIDGDVLKKGEKTLGKITRGISDWLLPDWDLPLKLPEVEKYEPSGDGQSPLATIPSWVHVQLGKNLSGYRETNTMPQWAGSCWYYLRFMDPTNSDAIVDPAVVKYWGEVDSYIGGAEHAVLHLLYARFWHKFLFDIGVVPTDEPFFRLRNVGLILGPDGNKMSKSKGNVINPDDVISEYGADTLRLYEMSMADFSDVAPWNTKAIVGSYRLLDKIYRLFTTDVETAEYKSWTTDDNLRTAKTMHKTIKKVGEDIKNMKFNTAIAAINIMVNEGIPTDGEQAHEWKSVLARLLQPFAPHMAEECWSLLGNEDSIYETEWPEYISAMTIDDEVQIAIQINGKLRGTYSFLRGVTAEEVRMTVENKPEISKWLEGFTVVKEIFIPNKILNIVVK